MKKWQKVCLGCFGGFGLLLIASVAFVLLIVGVVFLNAIAGDPTKPLTGGYFLLRFDSGDPSCYYVFTHNKNAEEIHFENGKAPHMDGLGVFEGIIKEIGWNENWILVWVKRGGDLDGWYALNVKTGVISGPISENKLKTNKVFSDIKTLPSEEVFPSRTIGAKRLKALPRPKN